MDKFTCVGCGKTKPLTDFYATRVRKDGTQGHRRECKECVGAKTLAYYHDRRDYYTDRSYWNRIFRLHGITQDDYMALLKAQKGRCAICRTKNPSTRSDSLMKWHVDHCHKTGKVRGLLCMSCNVGMGSFKDNAATMRRAADYVDAHAG